MTVICWGGKTLAADWRNTSEAYCTTITKLRLIPNGVAAAAGDGPVARALLEWAASWRLSDNFPE